MGMLLKLIIVLGLIFLIISQFTKSKAKRQANRDRWTNILLGILIMMLALSILSNFITR